MYLPCAVFIYDYGWGFALHVRIRIFARRALLGLFETPLDVYGLAQGKRHAS